MALNVTAKQRRQAPLETRLNTIIAMMRITTVVTLVLTALTTEITSFSSSLSVSTRQSTQCSMSSNDESKKGGIFSAIGNFFGELDAFVDDATNRRLGGGAAFYGKRKSSFYGEEDTGKKSNKNVADPLEDYQGPAKSGYFQWMQDDDGNMVPVTRMKKKNIERNPKFWDRAFASDKDED